MVDDAQEAIMKKRQDAICAAYEAQWNAGKGSHHPDYRPDAYGENVAKASRETEELLMAIHKNDVKLIYNKIEEGADVNFVFGPAYGCEEGYTALMSACHRGRLEAAKALLRSGADPNFINYHGDATIFWAIDGGPELIKLLHDYGADLDLRSPKDATPLSYARAMGKYGLVDEKGVYPEDVLKFYGASVYGTEPPTQGVRSPRESFDVSARDFSRDRGSYQREPEHP